MGFYLKWAWIRLGTESTTDYKSKTSLHENKKSGGISEVVQLPFLLIKNMLDYE